MPIEYREGTPGDGQTLYGIFRQAADDNLRRQGLPVQVDDDPVARTTRWLAVQPYFDHVAATHDQSWVAYDDGQALGYARSTFRDGLQSLTEYFVLPSSQGKGVGGELLRRAFPAKGARRRSIQAANDMSALARYLRAGVYPRFPIRRFSRPAEHAPVETDLVAEPATYDATTAAVLDDIDRVVVGHRRGVDHRFLLASRQLIIYRRRGRPVGYIYHAKVNGPAAMLDAADFPAVLALAECAAADRGEVFDVAVPLINRYAVDYLLGRRCQIGAFALQFMSDEPFGRFENYLSTQPAFIV